MKEISLFGITAVESSTPGDKPPSLDKVVSPCENLKELCSSSSPKVSAGKKQRIGYLVEELRSIGGLDKFVDAGMAAARTVEVLALERHVVLKICVAMQADASDEGQEHDVGRQPTALFTAIPWAIWLKYCSSTAG